MLARYVVSFLWGAALASAWWAAAVFGHGEAAVLWAAPIFATIGSGLGVGAVFAKHWNK